MKPASFVMSVANLEELPQNAVPHVALVGRSNAGKSTFVNHLARQKSLARVSSAPGRTQTMNVYDFQRGFYVVDLPGYGYAKTSHQKQDELGEIVQRYLTEAPQLKLVFLIISAVPGMTDLDENMLRFLEALSVPVVLVVNKIDKLGKNDAAKLLRQLAAEHSDLTVIGHSNFESRNPGEILHLMERAV